MKKIFATLMVMATLAILLPLETFAQTYTYRRVYRNGRWYTVRVYTPRSRSYNRYRRHRITPQERRRLMRQRMRINSTRYRIRRDGVVTSRERRRLNRETYRYRRSVRRARNN